MTRHITPRTTLRFAAALVTLGALAVAAGCGDDKKTDSPAETAAPTADIQITGQWARTSPSAVTIGAAYATFTSTAGDTIIGVSVDASVAKTAEMHEMVMAGTDSTMPMGGSDTTGMGSTETTMAEMVMQPVAKVDLPAGQAVEFKPGSYHFMLIDLAKPLEVGTSFKLTFVFEKAGSITVDVPVLAEAP